jgi:hypothetical protein
MTYDVTTHALRSAAAKALYASSATAFGAVAAEAEKLLGLDGTALTGDDAESAKYAIVRQTNLMIAADESYVLYDEERRGSRSTKARAGAMQQLDPIAVSIATALGVDLSETASFAVIRSLR